MAMAKIDRDSPSDILPAIIDKVPVGGNNGLYSPNPRRVGYIVDIIWAS